MKRLICIVCTFLLFCGCSPFDDGVVLQSTPSYITGVWLSFSELDQMLDGDFKVEFSTAVKNCKSRGITDIFVHIRPFCDSLYRSELFPLRESAQKYDFDVLSYMIDLCHKSDIKFHAWLNPYRVRTADSEIGNLPEGSPAARWLSDGDTQNDKNVSLVGGVYLNPASNEVRRLVTDGVREIIDNYAVDGIHFDDYFYPTTDEIFDSVSYNEYISNTEKPLQLGAWRRANVNALISAVYTAVKFKNKNLVFSVSPSASINDNYYEQYADVGAWVENGCVDCIIPQLYFGFDYPEDSFKFESLISDWQELAYGSDTRLLIGVATYKIGTTAEPDRTEWANGTDVIKRQIDLCKQNTAISGHIFFSYSSMVKYL